MYRASRPLFLSVQIGTNGLYKGLVEHIDVNQNQIDLLIKRITNYIYKNTSLLGLSLYGDFYNYDLTDIFNACKERGIDLGIDLDCNQQSMEYFYKYYDQFSLYRISIYSLNNEKNNHFFNSNYLEAIDGFVAHENVKKSGKVLVIPITKENINELPSIAVFGIENDFKVNPLILPDNGLNPFSNILTNKEYDSCIYTIKELLNIYGGNIYLDIPSGFDIIGKQAICLGFRYSADVCSDGSIRLCKFSRNRYYIDISQLDGFWAQYDESKYVGNKCINCKKYMMCGGGCLASAENNNGIDPYCNMI